MKKKQRSFLSRIYLTFESSALRSYFICSNYAIKFVKEESFDIPEPLFPSGFLFSFSASIEYWDYAFGENVSIIN